MTLLSRFRQEYPLLSSRLETLDTERLLMNYEMNFSESSISAAGSTHFFYFPMFLKQIHHKPEWHIDLAWMESATINTKQIAAEFLSEFQSQYELGAGSGKSNNSHLNSLSSTLTRLNPTATLVSSRYALLNWPNSQPQPMEARELIAIWWNFEMNQLEVRAIPKQSVAAFDIFLDLQEDLSLTKDSVHQKVDHKFLSSPNSNHRILSQRIQSLIQNDDFLYSAWKTNLIWMQSNLTPQVDQDL